VTHMVENQALRMSNIGTSYAWKMSPARKKWHSIVDMATLKRSMS